MTVKIVCDSACDLPEELAEHAGIIVVPLHVRFGATEYVDREELTTKDFWARCALGGPLPETAAPSPGAFAAAFAGATAQGADSIVCVTLSSKLSATYEAAQQAARQASGSPVEVVDSLSVTVGEGLVVLAAAEVAEHGGSAEATVAAAVSARERLHVFGVLDTLDNLRKGGRIGGAAAVLGTLLSIKPVIQVREGVVEEESRQRTRIKSLRYLADKVRSAAPLERLAVVGADAPDLVDFVALLDDVEVKYPVLSGEIGPVIGSHAGRGAIGAAWVRVAGA
ncbi:MAG TPA: DegV family protein [Acidimicrobiales bacterium]|nr:DegV family protein [Acidimicrobiales bacterium]